jgi:hypothetical protein
MKWTPKKRLSIPAPSLFDTPTASNTDAVDNNPVSLYLSWPDLSSFDFYQISMNLQKGHFVHAI